MPLRAYNFKFHISLYRKRLGNYNQRSHCLLCTVKLQNTLLSASPNLCKELKVTPHNKSNTLPWNKFFFKTPTPEKRLCQSSFSKRQLIKASKPITPHV